jgi:hypothetical protein
MIRPMPQLKFQFTEYFMSDEITPDLICVGVASVNSGRANGEIGKEWRGDWRLVRGKD